MFFTILGNDQGENDRGVESYRKICEKRAKIKGERKFLLSRRFPFRMMKIITIKCVPVQIADESCVLSLPILPLCSLGSNLPCEVFNLK